MKINLQGELTIMDSLNIKPNYAALGRQYGMDWRTVKKYHEGYLLFFKLFTASCCTLFTTIFKIILNATSHYSSPIMHIKYCYPKRSTLF